MMFQFRTYWVVGIALLVGNLAFASEQVRMGSFERSGIGLLFFPYPATVLLNNMATLHRVRSHRGFDQYFDALSLNVKTNGVERYGSGLDPIDSKSLPTLSPGAAATRSASHDDFASQDDEWHFSANPQLGANHEHEKGVTFSLRHGF